MKVKPIFIVGIPFSEAQDSVGIEKVLSDYLKDYYVITYVAKKDIEFKCFYEKDFDEIKYKELKDLLIKLKI